MKTDLFCRESREIKGMFMALSFDYFSVITWPTITILIYSIHKIRCILWGAVCNMHTFVDRSNFVETEVQNVTFGEWLRHVYHKSNFV